MELRYDSIYSDNWGIEIHDEGWSIMLVNNEWSSDDRNTTSLDYKVD